MAQEVAIRHPERVRRLVLACTSAGGPGGSSYPLHELLDLDPDVRVARQMELLDTRWDEAWRAAHPEQVALVAAGMLAGSGAPGSAGPAPGLANQLGARARHDTAARLGRSAAPPSSAPAGPTASPRRLTASSWRGAVPAPCLALVEGGHLFLVQDGTALPAIIEFLRRQRRPRRRTRRLPIMDVTATPEWKALAAHYERSRRATCASSSPRTPIAARG